MLLRTDSINGAIRRLIADKARLEALNYKTFNGVPIPFIGPEWIEIDFDQDHCFFGIIPACFEHNKTGRNLVGFCEDVNFDFYPQIRIEGKKWIEIKELLCEALVMAEGLLKPGCKDIMPYFYNLNYAIQELAKDMQWVPDPEGDDFVQVK